MISIKPIDFYYTDDDRAIIANKAELVATGKRRQAELVELDTAISRQQDTAPNQDIQVQDLIAGIERPRQKPLDAKRTTLQHVIREIEQALDFMAEKERQVTMKAGARLAKDIKPQVDLAERELAAALVIAHEKHLVCFRAKRALLNNGIGLFGLFDSNIDDILDIPVNKGTPLADYFRGQVAAGHLKNVPAQLR
jgi:hypothetical protein